MPHPDSVLPQEARSSTGELSPSQLRMNRRLLTHGLLILVGLCGYFLFAAEVEEPLHLYQGLAILVLAALPALQWARSVDKQFPVFEVFMLTSANVYALPLLNGHRQLSQYDPATISTAAWGVLLYQLVILAVHSLVRARPRTSAFWRDEIFPENVVRYLIYGTLVSSGYAVASSFFDVIPPEINSLLRAACFGIGIVCTFLAARMWGLGRLAASEKAFLSLTLALQIVAQTATLFLVGAVSILLLFVLGYMVGSRRVPLVLCVAAVTITALLHNGKSAMRAKYWADGYQTTPTIAELPSFFREWITWGLNPPKEDELSEREKQLASKLIDRTSLFHLMCLVIDVTPSRQPFLDGETYAFIPSQFVPRLLWPNKPLAHAATHRLSIYYGLQDEFTVRTTTIGFGLLTEAYANFGFLGISLVAAVIGAGLKIVREWSRHSPMVSYPGLFLVLLMAWSFQTEFTAAIWLGSLYQACVTVLFVPFVLRRLFGG